MRPALNLASRPFRNERLPALLVALSAVALALVTLRHAFVLKDLLPGRVSALDREALGLERELAELRDEEGRLRAPRPDPERLVQWKALRGLVDQRAFSWTTLLASLEDLLPQGVRLVSITPMVKDGRVTLDVIGVARRFEDRNQLLRALDESPEFEDVFLRTASDSDRGEEFTCTARYLPGVAPRPVEQAPSPPPDAPEESASLPAADASGGRS